MNALTMSVSTPEPLTIIVADDDSDSRELVAHVVRGLGHSCREACDGVEARAMHRAQAADVIISDWNMPKMDGLELCREIRESDPPYWHTHFIFLTGGDGRPRLVEGLHGGADEYITKPVDLAELEARLEVASRVVEARRALEANNIALRLDSEREHIAARTDPLTAISNRRRLKEDLEPLEGRAARYGHRYCAALCDIDEFKAYNDCFGHLSGDKALCRVARAIQDHLRSGDGLYRYGGEEFLAILPEQSVADARAGMDRVRHEVEKLGIAHSPAAHASFLTISVGISNLNGGTVDEWLKRADSALYRAKSLGRNRVETEERPPDAAKRQEPPTSAGPWSSRGSAGR
jgi:two-component system cell cycle response regulator